MAKIHYEVKYDHLRGAAFALTDSKCDGNYNYWRGSIGSDNSEFIIDLGCYQKVRQIVLRNGHGIYEDTLVSSHFVEAACCAIHSYY